EKVRKTRKERSISSPLQKTPVLSLQEEPTITEVQEKLPKKNIHVLNLEENPKENAKDLANLDITMMHTEEVTKKNDKNDDKLESFHIQEEVENQLLLNKAPRNKLTMKNPA
ncbi:7006_t:CDS:1, partial [Dentiscutata erythropus]